MKMWSFVKGKNWYQIKSIYEASSRLHNVTVHPVYIRKCTLACMCKHLVHYLDGA